MQILGSPILPLWPCLGPKLEIYHIRKSSESIPTLKFNDYTYLNIYKFQEHVQRQQKKYIWYHAYKININKLRPL